MLCARFMACCKPWPGVAEQLAQWQAVGARIGRVLVNQPQFSLWWSYAF